MGLLLIGFIVLIFVLILFRAIKEDNKLEKIKDNIIENTEISSIKYINVYDNYYLVLNKKYLYLIDNEYNIINKVDRSLIYKNEKNYDIIYKDEQFMYLNQIYRRDKLIYKYYDIYTYELIKKVVVGGNYGQSN